jgi:hypothetical protein
VDEAEVRRNFVIQHCQNYGFTYTIVPIETAYEVEQRLVMPVAGDMEDQKYQLLHIDLPLNKTTAVQQDILQVREKIKNLLSCVQPSFQADLILALKKQVIANFCLSYNFKRVLLATTGHGIASKLLGQLAKGRGASIANEVSYCGEQLYGQRVTLCRPMRDFL